MKRAASIIFIAFGLLAIAYGVVSGGEQEENSTTREPLRTQQQVQVMSSPSPSLVTVLPSATPSATPDWALATAVSFVATETERVRVVELEISRNNARFADAQSTGNAIRETEIVLTGTAAPRSGTATAAAEQTEVVEKIAVRTADIFAPTATVLAAKADAEADAAPYIVAAQVFSTFAVGLLALVIAGVAVGAIRRKPAAVVVKKNPIFHVAQEAGGTARVPEPPYSDYKNFMDWCAAVVAGETVAVDFWEKSGRFVGDYRKTHRWLVRWRLIMRHPKSGRAVLNPTGERVLTGWMVSNPLPQALASTKNAPLSTVYTDSVHTEAEGEGLVSGFGPDAQMGTDYETDD